MAYWSQGRAYVNLSLVLDVGAGQVSGYLLASDGLKTFYANGTGPAPTPDADSMVTMEVMAGCPYALFALRLSCLVV